MREERRLRPRMITTYASPFPKDCSPFDRNLLNFRLGSDMDFTFFLTRPYILADPDHSALS